MREYIIWLKGKASHNRQRYQEQLISALVPYMAKGDRLKVVNDAFSKEKPLSLKERYERTKQRYINAGILVENGK